MKRKLVFFIPLLFLLFASVPLCHAEWSLISKSGEWDICERTEWAKFNAVSNEGEASWSIDVNNFNGYYGVLNFTELYVYREWWHFWDAQHFDIEFKFQSRTSGDSATISLNFKDYQTFWGAAYDRKVNIWLQINEQYEHFGEYPYSLDPEYFEIYFTFNSSSVVLGVFLYQTKSPIPVKCELETVGVASNFQNITITINAHHYGVGHFHGFLTDNISETPPELPSQYRALRETLGLGDFVETIIGVAGQVPATIMNIINIIKDYGDWFLSGLCILGNIAVQIFPFFPYICLFWFLDAILTSVTEGNLQPIGNAVMTIYNTIRGIVAAIANIAETVWDIIKFW